MVAGHAVVRPPAKPGPKPAPRWHVHGAEWKGDTCPAAINTAARAMRRRHPRSRAKRNMDQNFNWFWKVLSNHAAGGEAYGVHYGVPIKDNYRHIVDARTGRVRPMTHAELHRPREKWTADEVARWRRGPAHDSYRPHTYLEHARAAVHAGITLVAELKNRAFGQAAVAAHMVAAAHKAGHRPVFMALYNLAAIREKAAAIVGAGGEFLVIYGKRQYLRVNARIAVRKWAVAPTWM